DPVTTLDAPDRTATGAALQALETLARPASEIELEGVVMDLAGWGVAGARIELRDLLPGPWEQPVPGNLVTEVSSDAEGKFSVKGCFRPGERYVLRVVHPDFAAARSRPIDPLLPATLDQVVYLGAG